MRDLVAACTAGLLGRKPAIDLSREEEQAGSAEILLATLTGTRKATLLEVEAKVPDGQFAPLYDMALQGCHVIAEQMRNCLLEHACEGFSLRRSLRSGKKV
ncbi:RRP41 [Symbiodinium natans]|uniref:RRP41 protein n=1 Tax=Symbiodinium natans TaxID=878477 RepID=A0A812PF73_9DINO|nr:RRP41 [Symbiodinium natans]